MAPLSFGIGKLGTSVQSAFQLAYGRYFSLQYVFTNGSDLDTRTSILTPNISGSVGYGALANISPYLFWGGDNTGTGYESVYFDKQQILNDFPGMTTIEIDCSCWWYGSPGSNPVIVKLSSFSGGTMVVSNFQWINPSSPLSFIDFASSPGIVVSRTYASPSGPQRVAKFSFNFGTNTLSITTN